MASISLLRTLSWMRSTPPQQGYWPNDRYRYAIRSVLGGLAGAIVGSGGLVPATAQVVIPQATASARVEQRQEEVQQIRPDNFDLVQHPVTDANADFWRNLLWTTAVVEPHEPYVTQAIGQILALASQPKLTKPQIRTIDIAMQVGTQLYISDPAADSDLGAQFQQTIAQAQDPVWVAMAFSALAKGGLSADEQQPLRRLIQQRFPNWANDVTLYTTLRDVEQLDQPASLPPLHDLLTWTIAPNQPQLYVLCRPNRAVLCQTILKNGSGDFAQQNGRLWTVPLLLRSLHNLSWNFSRGQTPQGIYRIEGAVPQPDTAYFRAYGLFALVNLFVPFETGVHEFVPGRRGQLTGGLPAYQALLPASWRNYFPIQQTYWAGKAGRSAFRIHGSGEAPTFFSNNARYIASADWNPTIGCLSALELYSDTGRLQQADMPKILDALTQVGGQRFTGYLIVVDVPGAADEPLTADEITAAVQAPQ